MKSHCVILYNIHMMKVREINERDIERLSFLMKECFSLDPWNENWDIKECENRLTSIVSFPNSRCLALEDENQIIGGCFGYILPFLNRSEYTLLEFFVSPLSQGKGNGSFLMNELKKELKKKGVKSMLLLTDIHCSGFYTKNGFRDANDDVSFRIEIE